VTTTSKEELVKRYGGWPTLLDPGQSPPPEFLAELSALGHSVDEFDARRAEWKDIEIKNGICLEFVLWVLAIGVIVNLI
jgi:hypothetical protein